nr:Gfo/Idh/MocA family oxidoreductase [Flexivirga meconopsidis]
MTAPAIPTLEAVRAATESAALTPFDAAIIGVGARAGLARHVTAVGGSIVAAVDPDPSTAQAARELFGEDVPLLPDVDTLLERFPSLDGAIVASPDDTHADIAVQLLQAGVPVYLEKPLAITTADCDRVLETARATGTKLYVGHNMRHMHVVRLMKQIIDRGEIGEVKAIWCRHFVGTGGDFYFKDWHAERARAGSLLLQKGAHDLDVMHWLAGSATREVTGIGDLAIYGQVSDRRDNSDRRMRDWFSTDNWPPLSQTELNPVVDVEDISMIMGRLDSGALISYQQCHFSPDYWRNYTVIGTEGRLENFGDGEGGEVRVWNARSGFLEKGHVQYPIVGDAHGHGDADRLTIGEFVQFVRAGTATDTSPVSARDAVAAGVAGAESIRNGSKPIRVPQVAESVLDYFANNQRDDGNDRR